MDRIGTLEAAGWKAIERTTEEEYPVKLKSKRLAAALADVWQSLPAVDRQELSDRITVVSDDSILRFILADSGGHFWGNEMYGCAVPHSADHHFIFLNSAELRRKSIAFVRYVIAHELAHVRRNHRGGSSPQHETEADELAAIWGYTNPDPLTLKIETDPDITPDMF